MAVRAPSRRPPAKRRDGLTPADFAKADHVRRARPPSAQHDADVYAQAADFARERDLDPSALFDEIEDRAAALALVDNVGATEAARLAWRHVLERYER